MFILIFLQTTLRGLGRVDVNREAIAADLDANWEVSTENAENNSRTPYVNTDLFALLIGLGRANPNGNAKVQRQRGV